VLVGLGIFFASGLIDRTWPVQKELGSGTPIKKVRSSWDSDTIALGVEELQ
jgi:hypothetical protein